MNEYKELTSLNHSILELFTIEELEDRLETDPMLFGTPLDASMQVNANAGCFDCTMCFSCGEFL